MRPDPDHPDVPPVAAVCVYPDLAGVAVERLRGSGVVVAAVATAFPSGRSSLAVKLADTALAVDAGAAEIDMVIDRGAFLTGPLRAGVRRDRRREGGLRPRAPEGHPGDRRARGLRRRPPRLLARAARGRRRDQDLHRQDLPRRHAARRAGDAAGRARLAPRHRRAPRRQGGGRDPHGQGRDPPPRRRQRGRRAGVAHARALPLRRLLPAQRPAAPAPRPDRGPLLQRRATSEVPDDDLDLRPRARVRGAGQPAARLPAVHRRRRSSTAAASR